MQVRPIPHEQGRYFVQSESKPDTEYTVDMAYVEFPGMPPRKVCGCYQMQCKGMATCKHVKAVEAWLKGQQ